MSIDRRHSIEERQRDIKSTNNPELFKTICGEVKEKRELDYYLWVTCYEDKNTTCVELLIQNGAKYSNMVLKRAVRNGCAKIVEILLKNDETLLSQTSALCFLSDAVDNGDSIMVEILLKHGAGKDFLKERMSKIAVSKGYEKIVEIFIRDKIGDIQEMFLIAIEYKKISIAKLLFKHGAKLPPNGREMNKLMYKVVRDNSCEMLELFIECELDIHHNHFSESWNMFESDTKLLELLLSRGSQLYRNKAAIFEAACNGYKDAIIKLFIRYGAKPTIESMLAEHAETWLNSVRVIYEDGGQVVPNTLIRGGAEILIDAITPDNDPAKMRRLLYEKLTWYNSNSWDCVKNGDPDNRGSDVIDLILNGRFNEALHSAAYYGYEKTVLYLLQSDDVVKADIHSGNEYALILAYKNRHKRTMQVLLENGADKSKIGSTLKIKRFVKNVEKKIKYRLVALTIGLIRRLSTFEN